MSDALLDESILKILEEKLGRGRVAQVVGAQLRHGAQLVAELTGLAESLDRARIRTIAHQVAGSSGSIGLTSLGEAAVGIEISVADLPADALRPAVHDLVALMRASFARLAEVYPESAP